MTPTTRRWCVLLAAAVTTLAAAACSSSAENAVACASTPLACPAGETCWPVDTNLTLQCIQSDPGRSFGAPCEETIDIASCGDGMMCDAPSANVEGTCSSYCDAKDPCPVGYSCQTVHFAGGGPAVSICRLGSAPADAGPSDAGGD